MWRRFLFCSFLLFLIACGSESSQLVDDPLTPDNDNQPLQESLGETDETPEGGQQQTVTIQFSDNDDPLDVEVTVIDGLALFEGDIAFGEIDNLTTQGVAVSSQAKLWPDAKVPVKISFAQGSTMYNRIIRALRYWEALTPIDFKFRTDENDYIEFVPSNSVCASHIGRQGGQQFIWLKDSCKAGSIVHEIGHAMGLFHEQSRSDRGQNITIFSDRIRPEKTHNFDLHPITSVDKGSYDYDSIMHYPAWAFKKPGLVCTDANKSGCTIVPKGDVELSRLGQRQRLSAGDIATIKALYSSNAIPIISSFLATPDNGFSPLTTTYSWSVSDADENDALSCTLDVDSDGTAEYSFDNCRTSSSQQHTFSTPDAYQATLTLKDGTVDVRKLTFVTVELLQNQPPEVEAGADQTITLPASVSLAGTVNDDGLPNPPAAVDVRWRKVSGPGSVSFSETQALATQVSFSAAGTYVFELSASDGERTAVDRVTVIVEGTPSEICGDGIDNDGDDQIDEDCDFERFVFVEDNKCEDDIVGVALNGEDLGATPRGKGRFYDLSELEDGEHTLVITALNSGGESYGCAAGPVVSYGVSLSEGLSFRTKNGSPFGISRDSGEIDEGSSNTYVFELGENPIIKVSNATFTEDVSGALSQVQFLTTVSLTIDFEQASMTGTLSGISVTEEDVRCFLTEDPDVTIDVATYEYTDSYTAGLETSFDPENKNFTIPLTTTGSTTAVLVTPFDDERCTSLNDDPAPGTGPWTGEGDIFGEVLKDGPVTLITEWVWFDSAVSGTWEGRGTVE